MVDLLQLELVKPGVFVLSGDEQADAEGAHTAALCVLMKNAILGFSYCNPKFCYNPVKRKILPDNIQVNIHSIFQYFTLFISYSIFHYSILYFQFISLISFDLMCFRGCLVNYFDSVSYTHLRAHET